MASLMTLAGSYGSLASHIPATATDSSINVDESEDVIILGKTLQETDTPLNPDYESRHSRSSLEEPGRPYKERWAHKVEFILSSLSMFLGLGSIWRFPFTVYENGGGAFLVPYFIFLFGIAKPLSVVDLSLGQFSGKGPYGIWDVVPILRGVGVLTVLIAATTLTYVCAILSFCVAYLYRGIQGKLPWVECNTDLYVKRKFIENLTCSPDAGEDYPTLDANSTLYYKSNAELYFQYNVVKLVENIDDGIGLPDIELVSCLFFVWLLLFLSFVNGAKSTGKVAICTAILPPIVLIAVFARALCLEGAFVGVIYFFKPDWEAILTFRVWRNALSQAFFSMAVGYGNIIYGSYNSFRETIKRDAIYIALMDVIYCLGAGVTVFSILGELSRRKGLKIEQIAQGDLGLAFVTYPEVLTYFGPTPYPQIFSFIFFTMLLSLGIGHSAAYFHPILATIYDIFPVTAKTHSRRVILTGFLCFLGFLCGLAYTAPGGLFIVHLIDHFLTGIIVYTAVVFELIGIFWIYGVSNYIQDVEFMLNTKVSRIYKLWCYCIPFFMLCVAVYTLIELEEPVVNVNHSPVEFPSKVLMMTYLFTIILLAIIPAGAVIVFCTRKTRSCSKKYLASVYPNTRWGPADPEIRGQWEIFKKSFHNKKNEGKAYQIMIGQLSRRKYRQKGEAGTSMEDIGDNLSGSGIPAVVYDKPSVVCNFQISSVNLSGHQQLDSNLEQFNEL